jgi:hypothetical protein
VQVICHSAIEIGPHCRIGPDCVLCDTNHHPVHEGDAVRVAPIRLGRNVWLGRGVIVLPGVTIGDHAVVAAGSVVAADIPAREVWRGNPACFEGRALLTRFRQALTKSGLVSFLPPIARILWKPTMLLTFIGAIQVLFGLGLFLAGSIEAMFAFLLVSALFGGSAAIVLPALGGSSIPPVQFALVFMALRLLVPARGMGGGRTGGAGQYLAGHVHSLWRAGLHRPAPVCWADRRDADARQGGSALYLDARLYLLDPAAELLHAEHHHHGLSGGYLLTAMAAHVVCSKEAGRRVFVRTMAIAGLVHGLIGFLSVVAKGTRWTRCWRCSATAPMRSLTIAIAVSCAWPGSGRRLPALPGSGSTGSCSCLNAGCAVSTAVDRPPSSWPPPAVQHGHDSLCRAWRLCRAADAQPAVPGALPVDRG